MFSGSEYVQVASLLYVYVLLLEIKLSRGEGWDPINRFNPPPTHIVVSVPSHDLNFQRHMSLPFCVFC